MKSMEALKCDFCGGSLIIDDSREFAKCEFCGTKYMASTLHAKIQEIRGTVDVVPGDNTKFKIKKDIDTFIRLGDLPNAIRMMLKYTDTFPDDPDGYRIKLNFICSQGCCPSYAGLTPHHVKNIDDMKYHKNNFFGSKYVFSEFQENITKLNELTAEENRPQYAKKLVNLIISGTSPFFFSDYKFKAHEPGFFQYREKYVADALQKIKNDLSNVLGDKIGLATFNKGVTNAQEYNLVSSFDNQVTYFDGEKIRTEYDDCIFLLGNQIVSYREYRYFDSEYYYSSDTLPHIPDIKKLTALKKKAETFRNQKLCQHCGGAFKGLFTKVCSKCGKPKDY